EFRNLTRLAFVFNGRDQGRLRELLDSAATGRGRSGSRGRVRFPRDAPGYAGRPP
ncbi:hypothetical protein, partial [Pseudomonas aeruginosa]|uniref:hypothetical protein n=1 Tax=Pseudomonas aeruginosa TaxID=287 RepID=UPI0039BE189B